jgi:hypothetical protein
MAITSTHIQGFGSPTVGFAASGGFVDVSCVIIHGVTGVAGVVVIIVAAAVSVVIVAAVSAVFFCVLLLLLLRCCCCC